MLLQRIDDCNMIIPYSTISDNNRPFSNILKNEGHSPQYGLNGNKDYTPLEMLLFPIYYIFFDTKTRKFKSV